MLATHLATCSSFLSWDSCILDIFIALDTILALPGLVPPVDTVFVQFPVWFQIPLPGLT
jgi:hypothetical protein